MLAKPNILILSSDERGTGILQNVLSAHANLTCAESLGELEELLEDDNCDAVLCDWSFRMGTWEDAVQEDRQRCPDLPVIILSRTGAERGGVEVLEPGAFDLLAPPYRDQTLLIVLLHAEESQKARAVRHRTLSQPERQIRETSPPKG